MGTGNDATLSKAGAGFERGPKAAHKYWKRVRVFSKGKAVRSDKTDSVNSRQEGEPAGQISAVR